MWNVGGRRSGAQTDSRGRVWRLRQSLNSNLSMGKEGSFGLDCLVCDFVLETLIYDLSWKLRTVSIEKNTTVQV